MIQLKIKDIDAKINEILPSENGYSLSIQVDVEKIFFNEKKEKTTGYFREMGDIGSQTDTVKNNPILKRITNTLVGEAIIQSLTMALQGSIKREDKSLIIKNIFDAFSRNAMDSSISGFFTKKLVCKTGIPLKSIREISPHIGTSFRDIWLLITITVKKQ